MPSPMMYPMLAVPSVHDDDGTGDGGRFSRTLKQPANGIAAGSERDLILFCKFFFQHFHLQRLSSSSLVLPALFVNVDVTRLPRPPKLDTQWAILPPPREFPSTPPQTCGPASGNGSIFFRTYWDYLPISEVFKQIPASIIHSPIIIAMDKDAKTSEVLRSTPGFRLVLALAWRGMLGEDDHQVLDRPGTLLAISETAAIATDDTNVGGNFDELVEAAGGRVTDLASMVAQHFPRAHSARKSQATALFLLPCISILDEHTDPTRSLCNALRSIGFVAIPVRIISTVHDTAAESVISDCAQSVLIACLDCLVKMLKAPPDIALAIDSGLLQLAVVIAASIKGVTDGKYMIIQRMFDKVLIPSLVHCAVVAQLQKCFPEAAAVAARSTIGKSPFAVAWKNLSTLIRSRIGFLDSWEGKARPSWAFAQSMQ
ncbi:hypothetical protein B0H19DRAFT_1074690 [Mycena capillaripes]|nr:hypothetical protein B0H19DRAFT_1074690 [Mycena capillaripes]